MKPYRIILVVLVYLFAGVPAFADSTDGYPTLWESYDVELQENLERTIGDLGLQGAVKQQKLGLVLVDITDLEEPRVAALNGDKMFYAASMPKIAILLGAFVEIERGTMRLDADTKNSLTQMIRVSSNADATRMLNAVGKDDLLKILQSDRFRLYDRAVNGGLWVGKEYSKSPAYRRDPLHNLSHGATALQAARFYYLMETGQLVSPRLTAEMKKMLSRPGIKHKFVKGLANFPGTKIYRKSGSWSHYHADSALIEAGGHRYIVVGLVEDARGGDWLADIIAPLHRLIVPTKSAKLPQ